MRKTLIYIDACCFGVFVEKRIDVEAQAEMRFLLAAIEYGRLRFLHSSWLRTELSETRPVSKARKLLSYVPQQAGFVGLSAEVKQEAQRLARWTGLESDPSGLYDCRHLASALHGGANFLVTFDSNFHEKCRQHVKLFAAWRPFRVVWLPGWEQEVYGEIEPEKQE
ncbi:MAG: hypothetical protein IT462_04295 [Planctomycetes bacterium]|nr:hypothetical protein [Planctomycetota bacterium]